MEEAITVTMELVKGWKADEFWERHFSRTARNFNPLVARAARFTTVEVEEICAGWFFRSQSVHLPGNYVID